MDPELMSRVDNAAQSIAASVREAFVSGDITGYATLRKSFADATGGRYVLGVSPDAPFAFRIFHRRAEYFEQTGRLPSVIRSTATDDTFVDDWQKDYAKIQRSAPVHRLAQSSIVDPEGLTVGLLDSDGIPLKNESEASSALAADIVYVTQRMKAALARQPDLLYRLDGRQFEEVVAELLHDRGYDVNLSPKGPDGGVDIYAAERSGIGSFLYLVQCKKYAAHRPVSLDVVQRLHGRVAADKATAGLLVTTSHFTRPAEAFAEQVRYQLSLREFQDLYEWLSIWRGKEE